MNENKYDLKFSGDKKCKNCIDYRVGLGLFLVNKMLILRLWLNVWLKMRWVWNVEMKGNYDNRVMGMNSIIFMVVL